MDFVKFANYVLDEMFQFGNVDGGDIQDMGLQCGLLETKRFDEPCGSECVCADLADGFPLWCNRKTYLDREGETAVNRLKAILGKFDSKVSDGVLLTGKEAGTLVKVGIVQWLRGVLETEAPKGW